MQTDYNNDITSTPTSNPISQYILPYSSIRYPQLISEGSSSCIFNALKDATFGRYSTLTLLASYYYQNAISSETTLKNSLLSLIDIAKDHLYILSYAINLYGGIPNYKNSNGDPWTSTYVCFEQNAEKFLLNDICLLNRLIKKYELIKRCSLNASLSQLVDKLIADSYAQIEYIKNVLSNL